MFFSEIFIFKKAFSLNKKFFFIIFIIFVILVILVLMLAKLEHRVNVSLEHNTAILKSVLMERDDLTNFDVIFNNEIYNCLMGENKNYYKLVKSKVVENLPKINSDCISIRMRKHLSYDASRYDFLSKLLEKNGIEYDLKEREINFDYLYED